MVHLNNPRSNTMNVDTNAPLNNDLDNAAQEVVRDVKRGAARVEHAVEEGAAAIDDALHPRFGTQFRDMLRSLTEDPSSTPGLARDLVQDHPIASVFTAAAVGACVAKLIGAVRSR
jgi:ElaB/YqjD/DUF883 family membrane-anchored ribosome-binding protein